MTTPDAADTWNPQVLRDLLVKALPEETSLHGSRPDPCFVYLPPSHVKALRPDAMVVVGMRGAGKSFWWSALQDPKIRALVSQLDPHAEVKEQTEVAVGFGERPDPGLYPDRDTLGRLLHGGAEPRLIWRTVVAHKLAPEGHAIRSIDDWSTRVAWVTNNPEPIGRLLAERDLEFERNQIWFLVLLDALDRSASDWRNMHRLIRGLLETALEFRPYRRLRVKCFLRTDQLDESRVADFPDASKVLSSRVELSWFRHDLYGLLWQHLANADHPGAEEFRKIAEAQYGVRWSEIRLENLRVWRVSPEVKDLEEAQRALFHDLAGEWMGRDRRRGFPYSWIPNHLADARGRTSPRSFLAALRAAAEDTRQRYPNWGRALHYESIKRGVQRASQIRVAELKEDYPWVDSLMGSLKGLVVPCDFREVVRRWERNNFLKEIQQRIEAQEERLPPAHLEERFDGLRKELEELGIFVRMGDDRVNIPDVFRVGYGLGRRGGVKPIRRREEA